MVAAHLVDPVEVLVWVGYSWGQRVVLLHLLPLHLAWPLGAAFSSCLQGPWHRAAAVLTVPDWVDLPVGLRAVLDHLGEVGGKVGRQQAGLGTEGELEA